MSDFNCYCGKGFHVDNPSLLLLEAEQFCSVDCVSAYIADNRLIKEVDLDSNCKGFTPMESKDCWDSVTKDYYRSAFEIHFARYLKSLNVKFVYELNYVNVGSKKYYPDFWLPELGKFFEVKGLWGMGSKGKTRKAIEIGVPLVLIPAHLIPEFRKRFETKLDRVRR